MRAGFSFSYPPISLLLGQPLSIKKSYAGAIQHACWPTVFQPGRLNGLGSALFWFEKVWIFRTQCYVSPSTLRFYIWTEKIVSFLHIFFIYLYTSLKKYWHTGCSAFTEKYILDALTPFTASSILFFIQSSLSGGEQ
jgi:hypothetical protein